MRMGETVAALAIAAALSTISPGPGALAGEQSVTVGIKRNVEATLHTPDGPGPYPGILVMHPSVGLEQADRAASQLEADAAAAAPVDARRLRGLAQTIRARVALVR